MNENRYGREPSSDDFMRMAAQIMAELPAPFRRSIDGVAILIEDFADTETLQSMDIGNPFNLLGLYHGVSIEHKSVLDAREDQDRIFLYRRPLLAFWADGTDSLENVIRNVLIHEIGHHFGFSDDDMHHIEDEA